MSGLQAVGSVRRAAAFTDTGASVVAVGDLSAQTDWSEALAGVEAVVHTAARVHVMVDAATDPLEEFRKVNVAGTEHLARAAAASGAKRFVYVSSIGVNGAQTALGKPFSETDKPNPHNAYTLSKWEAEQGLLRVADETGMEVVIIRPPLVYGCGAPGNFGSLMRRATGLALAAGRGAQPAQPGGAGQSGGFHRHLHHPPPSGQPDFFGE